MEPTSPGVETPPEPRSSLVARLMNVFAAPGEVFDEVKATPTTVMNWLAPAILAAVAGVVATLVIFSQPTILRQVREEQEKAMQQQVEAGKMTQQQADRSLEAMGKFTGPMMKIAGSAGAVVMSFARLFWWGLVLWLIAKWALKADIRYMKAVEIAGLSSLIITLGAIVELLLGVLLGKMIATVSPALFLKEFDPTSRVHFMLGAVNLFKLWAMVVLSLGLARLTGVPWGKATLLMLIYWAVFTLMLIGLKLGQFTL